MILIKFVQKLACLSPIMIECHYIQINFLYLYFILQQHSVAVNKKIKSIVNNLLLLFLNCEKIVSNSLGVVW